LLRSKNLQERNYGISNVGILWGAQVKFSEFLLWFKSY